MEVQVPSKRKVGITDPPDLMDCMFKGCYNFNAHKFVTKKVSVFASGHSASLW
jgi:hypothetical protein